MSTAEVETPLVAGPEIAGTLMTPDEFDAIEEWDEDYRYELVHGVLVVSPPPLEQERGPNQMLGYWLLRYQEDHAHGSTLDETLPEHTVRCKETRRRADRVIWAGLGRKPNTRRDTPTIAAEFVSAGKRSRHRDYEQKRDEYRAIRIQEYWIFDRFARTMTVHRLDGTTVIVHENETYTTPLLPGFELDLAKLLAVADRYA
jgi:Uma2 family endonuclease